MIGQSGLSTQGQFLFLCVSRVLARLRQQWSDTVQHGSTEAQGKEAMPSCDGQRCNCKVVAGR